MLNRDGGEYELSSPATETQIISPSSHDWYSARGFRFLLEFRFLL